MAVISISVEIAWAALSLWKLAFWDLLMVVTVYGNMEMQYHAYAAIDVGICGGTPEVCVLSSFEHYLAYCWACTLRTGCLSGLNCRIGHLYSAMSPNAILSATFGECSGMSICVRRV